MKARVLIFVLLFAASLSAGVVVHNADYHGLKAITLRNRSALVIVVPKTGRILSFQLCDYKKCEENPIWNNPQLGAGLKPDGEGWTNYGGDKSWPAPQSDWPKITGKGWPPPTGFDHMPFVASTKGSTLILTSPVDPSYGIRVRRTISLDESKPVLHVETTYEKISGSPIDVSVWTITQLNSPDRGYILLPERERFPGGYLKTTRSGPNDPYPFESVSLEGRLLSFTRDPKIKRKLGSDGDRLLWVGKTQTLLIEQKGSDNSEARYPDDCHSQIYTNPDELPYVEFELFSPLRKMNKGDTASLAVTYRLAKRDTNDSTAEAKHIFGIQ